jgi:hypothetical protein
MVVGGAAHPDLLLDGWRLFTAVTRAVRRDLSTAVRSLSREAAAADEERASMDRQVEATVWTDLRAKP